METSEIEGGPGRKGGGGEGKPSPLRGFNTRRGSANIIKMAPKIDPKSMKNRGCVAGAFLERFGATLAHQKGSARIP